MKGAPMRADCERIRGTECTFGCTNKCRRKQLEEEAGESKRGPKKHVAASIAAYAERVRAMAKGYEDEKRLAKAVEWAGKFDAALMRDAERRRLLRRKPKDEPKHGFDGNKPDGVIIRDGHRAHIWNATTNRVAGLRGKDPTWTERMARASSRYEHDYRLSTQGAISGQFAQEHVDGGGVSSGPNLAVLNASDSLRAAQARLSEEEVALLGAFVFRGVTIRVIAAALRLPNGTVSRDIKRALDALADHYGLPRSSTQRRSLARLREAVGD